MKKAGWGPIVWKALHCITLKIKNEEFEKEKNNIIKIISDICTNLPCPQCASHASNFIRRYKMKNIKNKDELIKYIFLMHNNVNKRLKKKSYNFDDIEIYNSYDIKNVLTDYYKMNINLRTGERMMLHNYHRKMFISEFYNYFNGNIAKFD